MTFDNLPSKQDRIRGSIEESFYLPGEELDQGEMRITFMGTSYISRVGQACNSVFIECGNGESFVFDCGSGVCAKYVALGVPWSRMTRVFLTHLHADHMSDLAFIYCFGPGGDRRTALHVYGPSGPTIPTPYPSGSERPGGPEREHPEEGTKKFCELMKQMCKWHTESFSFLQTGIKGSNGEKADDGYNIEAHELNYRRKLGEAYTSEDGKVKIWHFPAAHDRDGAISYKLEFNGMSVVFSGDTVPTKFMLDNASDVHVLIHEMQLDPVTLGMKESGLQPGDPLWDKVLKETSDVVSYSHTPPGKLGRIFNLTKPQLGVITHFPINQDTLIPALDQLRKHYPRPIALATDAMVLNLKWNEEETGKAKLDIRQRMGLYSDYAWNTNVKFYKNVADAKYTGPQWSEFILENVLWNGPDEKDEDKE